MVGRVPPRRNEVSCCKRYLQAIGGRSIASKSVSLFSEAVIPPRQIVIHLVARGLTRVIKRHNLATHPRHRWLGVRGRSIAACVVGCVTWPVDASVCEVLQLDR